MKKIIFLCATILFLSCSPKKGKTYNSVKYDIHFLNWSLNIPENYVMVSFDNYKDLISESYTDSTLIASKLVQIEHVKNTFENYAMFCDKDNFENTFTIVGMINPLSNSFINKQLATQIHSSLRENGKSQGYIYKPMENRLINGWLIKIKGEKYFKDSDISIYQTNYMSSNFGAFVSNTEKELDFEAVLTE